MSGINVNAEVGGYAYGSIIDTPFMVGETLVQLGPLAEYNVARDGVQPDTDTFDFWWSKRMTGYVQDNMVWTANLVATWLLGTFPTPKDSYLRRLAAWSARNRAGYVGIRLMYPAVSILAGYSIVYPDDRVSKWFRSVIRMPREFTLRGVA